MLNEGIQIEELAIRSRADLVNKNKRILYSVIALAKKHKFKIMLQQLGFESFIQKDLNIYNKGYRAAENLKAIRLIRRLKKVAPEHFQDRAHGMIGINPWLTLQDLKNYVSSKTYMQLSGEFMRITNTLKLYDQCLPIYQKLREEGLLIERKADLDTYRFKDKGISRFLQTMNKIDLYLRKKHLFRKKSQHKYIKLFKLAQMDILNEIRFLKLKGNNYGRNILTKPNWK